MAIDKQTQAEILRLFFAEKWTIGTIARELGVHHNTVDRIVAEAGVPLQLRGRKPSKLDPLAACDLNDYSVPHTHHITERMRATRFQ